MYAPLLLECLAAAHLLAAIYTYVTTRNARRADALLADSMRYGRLVSAYSCASFALRVAGPKGEPKPYFRARRYIYGSYG